MSAKEKIETVANTDELELDQLQTIEDLRAAFARVAEEESKVDSALATLLGERGRLQVRLRSLSKQAQAPDVRSALADARRLSQVVGFTASLAEGVSAKVRQLDEAKRRVSDCQQRVHDLIDLQLCSEGVRAALAEEDYEQAAAHLHRFLAMDEALLKLTASELGEDATAGGSGSAASLEVALRTLHEAETKVRAVVARRFDEAVADEDLASIERFFKIFPLINMHDEGLKKFTAYLCTKILAAAKKNLNQARETPPNDARAAIIYADTMTLLFEGVARTVEIHQPLIETYYGPGRLLTVAASLQIECDRQAVEVAGEFRRRRALSDKVARVREATAAALAPSASSLSLAVAAAAAGQSPATALSGAAGVSQQPRVDIKGLDAVLSELALLQARAEMYYKFVRKRVNVRRAVSKYCTLEILIIAAFLYLQADIEVATDDESVRKAKDGELETMLANSKLCHTMQDLLADYILLEDHYMTANIRKALDLAEPPTPESSVMLDDIFFILKKCVQRAAGSHNVDSTCAVLNNVCSVLDKEFCDLLQAQVRLGFPVGYLDNLTHAYNVIHSSYQHGKLQGGDMNTEKQKLVFLVGML